MPRPGRSHSLMAAFARPGVEDAAPGPAQASLAALMRAAGGGSLCSLVLP